jgi:hypothetical protein
MVYQISITAMLLIRTLRSISALIDIGMQELGGRLREEGERGEGG